MKLSIYQVDAFTNTIFGGNPAAVIPLENWIADSLMQKIALENNLAETVFFVPKEDGFHIRWFTPELEIDLCGHATLASAFVLYEFLGYTKECIRFFSKSGDLFVNKKEGLLQLDFPSRMPKKVEEYPAEILEGLGTKDIVAVYKSRDYIIEFENAEQVKNIRPDFSLLNKVDVIGIIVTAPGKDCDFVSRFFAPNCGIPEDPVTGSAHSSLIPFWSEKLDKKKLFAKQLSQRGGELWCEQVNEERVYIAGECAFFMKGEIIIP